MAHQSLRRSFLDHQDPSQYWMIVEWYQEFRIDGEIYGMISSDDLPAMINLKNLYTGKQVEVFCGDTTKKGSVVIASNDKRFLEMEIIHLREVTDQIDLSKKVPSKENVSDSDAEDFQGSDSDWNPNPSDCGSDDANPEPRLSISLKRKRGEDPLKLRQHRKTSSKKSTRANPSCQANTSQFQGHNGESTSQIINLAALPNSKEPTNSIDIVNDFDKIINDSKQRLITGFKNVASTDVSRVQGPPMTFDQQTQTNASTVDDKTLNILLENQKLLRTEMMNLYTTLDDLKNQMHRMQKSMHVIQNLNSKYKDILSSHNITERVPESNNPFEYNMATEDNTPNNLNNSVLRVSNSCNDSLNGSQPKPKYFDMSTPVSVNKYGLNVSNGCSSKEGMECFADSNDMISIGSGKTEIPRHIFSQIKWNSYSSATRKLLMAVFPRRTLATHSLTGKPSPAFNSRPPKLQLDAKKISDIIITVSQMCNVPENMVRTVITTKCSDENKMYKLRQKKLKNKNPRDCDTNQENELPDNSNNKNPGQSRCNNVKKDISA